MRYYEVWGWDTFAGEEYFCGRYNTRKEAVKELLKKEKRCRKNTRRKYTGYLLYPGSYRR